MKENIIIFILTTLESEENSVLEKEARRLNPGMEWVEVVLSRDGHLNIINACKSLISQGDESDFWRGSGFPGGVKNYN